MPAFIKSVRQRPALVGAAVVIVVVALVGTLAFAGRLPFGSSANSPEGSPAPSYPAVVEPPLIELTQSGSTEADDGSTVTDAHGVTIALAKGSVVNASAVHLVASDLPASLDSALAARDGWKRTSPVYSLELDKDSDVVGPVPLSFPAAGPDDRVAVLMDRRYVEIMGVQPSNGRLTVQASTESSTAPAFEGEGDHYFVVSKATAAWAPDAIAMADIDVAQPPALPEASGGMDAPAVPPITCVPSTAIPSTECWNAAKTISFKTAATLDAAWQARVAVFMDRVNTIMLKYASLHFQFATPTAAEPIRVVINPDPELDPRYSPNLFSSAKVNLGFRTIADIAEPAQQQLLAHELFHWVQHHTYPMRVDGNNYLRYWHHETQAEAASFMVDPTYQAARLLKVASQLQDNGIQGVLGWQKAGGDWDHGLDLRPDSDPSRYVQGQVVSLGICDTESCIESQADLVEEVNTRTTHYSAVNYHWGLDNTARYLLGTAPKGVTVDLTAPILKTGRGIGDYIHLSQEPGVYRDYAIISAVANETKTPASGEVAIRASIASNGLYPLRVSNGSDVPLDDNCLPGSNRFSGLQIKPNAPYLVHLEAGVELYWRIGEGPLQHSDGSKPVDIGPITSEPSVAFQLADLSWTTKPGIPSVRIVAVNQTKDAVTLIGSVTPQAPKMVATPNKVDKPDPNTPVKLRVDMTQVALNFAGATAEWDFGDGSPTVQSKITPDAKLTANVTTTHTFRATSTGVRVTFRDKAGKALAWDPVNIAVGAAAPTGGHWVLSSAVPDKTTFNGVQASSSNGRFSASWDATTPDGQIHTEGALSWAPPPATAIPGDKWTTTLAASYSSTKCFPGQESSVGVDARWWAADGTHKDDFFRAAADCSSGPASKPLSWPFPALTMCDTDKACTIDITVGAMSGANGASVFWTYTYVWKS